MPLELEKNYSPTETEPRIYQLWEKSGFFNPDNLPDAKTRKPFTVIMPPPNANGDLHAGHALTLTLEDIMIRFKRMQGYKTLWVPGADHAGFETQVVYEKKLEKEGRSRFGMDRKQLYDEILAFTLENKKNMEQQVKLLGASCDWSREKFTLDKDVVEQTQQTFKKMFADGLIYRGPGMVNWCTKHQTSLSDVETEDVERDDTLYYLTYGPLTVATVRPETIFGDVAVAVNPEDVRYKEYIGKTITVTTPIGQMELMVVGDELVDKEFGTGALKITPAHDANDFALAKRHGLPTTPLPVIDQYGKMTEKAGKYAGLKIAVAREQVVKDLEDTGLIVKKEAYRHSVPTCYKCGTTIEPRILDQWFVRMQPLATLALQANRQGKVKFVSEHFEKIFTYWMEHTIDWNISRQIVWGIPIPAKICEKCGHGLPDSEDFIKTCFRCGGNVKADTDTFDTWFSSGQWPYLVLGYPNSSDFKTYYPTDVMETGRDLIFKWIPRMIIFGLYRTHAEPFKTVYMHGMVNDAKGRKMSKSVGNVISPITLTEKFGTDALRMGLVIGNTPGMDMSLAEDKIKGYKNFANKLWNIARFILAQENIGKIDPELKKEFDELAKDITLDMENYRFYLAAEKIYHYIWHRLADELIEEGKSKEEMMATLYYLLENSLKLLHPFMPFVTEEIYGKLPPPAGGRDKQLLMVEKWPA